MKIRLKYFIIGALFGMCFPLGAISFELHNTSQSLSVSGIKLIHGNNPILFMIDTAPLFLGLFAFLGGVSKEKSVLLINQLKGVALQLSQNTQVLQRQTEDTLVRFYQSIKELISEYSDIEKLNRSSYQAINNTLEGTDNVSKEIGLMNNSLHDLAGFNKTVEANNSAVKEYLEVYLTNISKLQDYFEFLTSFSVNIETVAINSAIEANKMGVNGKAFLVFSQYIQELARVTKSRTKTVVELIDQISGETVKLSELIETERENIGAVLTLGSRINTSTGIFSNTIDTFIQNLEEATQNLDRQNNLTTDYSNTLHGIGNSNIEVMKELDKIIQQQIEIISSMNELT